MKNGNKNHRLKEQKNTLYNIAMLCKARSEAIKFYDKYSLMISEAKTKATNGTGLKINKFPNKCFKDYQQLLHK